jgi:ubiquitin-protein ligase
MTALATRRETDVQKLQAMSANSGGRIRVVHVNGTPPTSVEVQLAYPTAGSKSYPASVQRTTNVVIDLGARYPFSEPRVAIKSPIIHPNVYASGQVCLGSKWMPTQGLDLLLKRLIAIITYDPAILNANSPANRDALNWYTATHKMHPSAFPTTSDTATEVKHSSSISWNTVK